MKSSSLRFFLTFCLVSLVACVLSTPGFAADPLFKLKYATFFPPMHPHSVLADQWCKELEKRTDGRVTTAFFPAGTLVSANATYDGVVKGIVDMGFWLLSLTPRRVALS